MKKILFLMAIICVNAVGQNDYFVSTQKDSIEQPLRILTKEQEFVYTNFKNINIADWHKGMRFMAVYQVDMIDVSRLSSKTGKRLHRYYHQIITVDTVLERKVECPKGLCTRTYITFDAQDGNVLEYEYIGDRNELRDAKVGNSIEGIAYLEDVDTAKKMLLGKTLYSMVDIGYHDTENGKMRASKIKKFAPYIVQSIGVGNSECPVKIIAKNTDGKEIAFLVAFSGINKPYGNFLWGNGYFYDVFMFSNPRLRYKNISAPIWNLIMNGKVQRGMTKEQCRLSWGNPEKVNVTTASFGTHEQWVYYGDRYLYFENGKLTAIQN